jgi:predicted RNase H-like nuclease (RuvC/YqgF family)
MATEVNPMNPREYEQRVKIEQRINVLRAKSQEILDRYERARRERLELERELNRLREEQYLLEQGQMVFDVA